MELSKRQVQITEWVRKDGFLTVEALAEKYNVTTQTIRRDLTTLCDFGLARRRHGGIERPAEVSNLAYGSRQILARGAKQAIAREVAKHIPDNASVAFSIGTTPEVVAAALLQHNRLRIFTNNLNIAMLACANPTFEVNIAGGRVRNSDNDILGPGMEAFLSSYVFDFGIYGVAGVGEHGTLLDFYEEEVRARRLIHENSRATILVLDHTKFGRTAHVRGGQIGEATKVFCDTRPPKKIMEALEQSGSQLVICDENKTR
ncbi:MAG: DeoR family transcriptional regulator [Gammaproteobacteria bacterium]|nr:DeoR family transcriptional regulator [Gammaproteobacteria bacterium]